MAPKREPHAEPHLEDIRRFFKQARPAAAAAGTPASAAKPRAGGGKPEEAEVVLIDHEEAEVVVIDDEEAEVVVVDDEVVEIDEPPKSKGKEVNDRLAPELAAGTPHENRSKAQSLPKAASHKTDFVKSKGKEAADDPAKLSAEGSPAPWSSVKRKLLPGEVAEMRGAMRSLVDSKFGQVQSDSDFLTDEKGVLRVKQQASGATQQQLHSFLQDCTEEQLVYFYDNLGM